MFLKKTRAETSNKNGLDFFHFNFKYQKNMLNACYLITIYICTYIYSFHTCNNYSLNSVLNIRVLQYCGKKTIQNNFNWHLKFHTGKPTIFSQVQRSLKIYSIIVS